MLIRFAFHVAAFALFYGLALLAALPFLVYFGKPKPWQKFAEFLLSFPFDYEKLGFSSFSGSAIIVLFNGLLWGIAVLGCIKLVEIMMTNIKY